MRPKVFVHGRDAFTLRDPVKGFPFSLLPHDPVKTPEEADFILLHFGTGSTDAVNQSASGVSQTPPYQLFAEKYVTCSLCDFPLYTKWFKGVKFALSPMQGIGSKYQTYPFPLHPVKADYDIAMDRDYTAKCRGMTKKYDFAFLGQLDDFPYKKYGGREWLKEVREKVGEDRFFIRSKHINALSHEKEWGIQHREWMQRVGESAYGFCPVGGGDATMDPRLYWTMQVGTVPIITDPEFLAFQELVDWDEMAVFVEDKVGFDYDSLPMPGDPEYDGKRERVMAFWDDWCWYPHCAKRLFEHYLEPRL